MCVCSSLVCMYGAVAAAGLAHAPGEPLYDSARLLSHASGGVCFTVSCMPRVVGVGGGGDCDSDTHSEHHVELRLHHHTHVRCMSLAIISRSMCSLLSVRMYGVFMRRLATRRRQDWR
jgi:hypothetical protein